MTQQFTQTISHNKPSSMSMPLPGIVDSPLYELSSSSSKNDFLVSKVSLASSSLDDTPSSSVLINPTTSKFIQDLKNDFQITKPSELIHHDFLESYKVAHEQSEISMIPIFKISEHFNHKTDIIGKSLVIDIGGSTIRMAIIDFNTPECPVNLQKHWILNENEKLIDLKFFINIVERAIILINEYNEHNDERKEWKIGITWSFPLNQQNQIITMGKGFHVSPEVQNQSIDKLITSIFNKNFSINAKVYSIINDSIAVNLSGLINYDFNSQISFILGTGLNSCIFKGHDLINTELGFFGELPQENITKYDKLLDSRWGVFEGKPYLKNDVGDDYGVFMPLEFLSSGRYVSEILRLIIIDLVQDGHVSNSSELQQIISEPFGLHGSFICSFDQTLSFQEIQSKLLQNFNMKLTDEDILILQPIIDFLLERTALLVTQSIKALSSFVHQVDQPQINVNYIGSFLYHCTELQAKISRHSLDTIHLNHIDNSSLVGAAVAVCINTHES